VTNPNIAGHSPSWSPTGDRIAYLDPQGYVLKVMNPDGTGVRQVGSADGSYAFGIDWSPDGKWIVAKNARIDRIELVNATTGVALPLGFTNGMSGPSWRP
jgi:Tol biopolymer transport system component